MKPLILEHSAPGGAQGDAPDLRRGRRNVPVLILKPPSSPLRWAFTVRLAKLDRHSLVLQSHWTLRLKGEVREGHVEINFLPVPISS